MPLALVTAVLEISPEFIIFSTKEEKAIKSMMKLPEITGLYTTNGKWDLAAEITSTSLEGFDRAISALRSINGVLETETSLLLSSRIGE